MKQIILFLLGMCLSMLQVQGVAPTDTDGDPRLYLNGTTNHGNYIEVSYEVTYPGFVELQLFDDEGNKLWVTGIVTDEIGPDAIKIPTKPLKSGEWYDIIVLYKGDKYEDSFKMD